MQVQTKVIRTQTFVYQKLRKTNQRQMHVTQQFQNFDYEFLLPIPNAFTVATEEYYARRYKMNDAKAH